MYSLPSPNQTKKKKTFMYLGHICLLSLPQYSIFFPTNIYTILTKKKKKKKKNIRCANLEKRKESTRLERCVSQFGTRVIAAPKRAIQHLFGITCSGLLRVSLTFEIINKAKSREFILKVRGIIPPQQHRAGEKRRIKKTERKGMSS